MISTNDEEKILTARGYFWSDDITVAEGKFAPDEAVAGTLIVYASGRSHVDLDGVLSPRSTSTLPFALDLPDDVCLHGILRDPTRHVKLGGLKSGRSHFTSSGISAVSFNADFCLIGDAIFPVGKDLKFKELEIDLSGYERWIDVDDIVVNAGRSVMKVSHKKVKSQSWSDIDGSMKMECRVEGNPGRGTAREYSISESWWLSKKFRTSVELREIRVVYGLLEDFFIILTSLSRTMQWPKLTRSDKSKCDFYFHRRKKDDGTLERRCWPAPFYSVDKCFGNLFSEFRKVRDSHGPGIYLYLGGIRNKALYIENHFMNIMFGLEAFHRRGPDSVLEVCEGKKKERDEKVGRILESIQLSADKKWAKKKLKERDEITLGERVFELFSAMPLPLNRTGLLDFSNSCAGKRNDISHYGADRHGGSYDVFLGDIFKKIEVLRLLYHALIMLEIGVPAKVVIDWLFFSTDRVVNERIFKAAGIFDSEAFLECQRLRLHGG